MTAAYKSPRDAACSFVALEATKHIDEVTGDHGSAGDAAYVAIYASLRKYPDDEQLFAALKRADIAGKVAGARTYLRANGPYWVKMDIDAGYDWFAEQEDAELAVADHDRRMTEYHGGRY